MQGLVIIRVIGRLYLNEWGMWRFIKLWILRQLEEQNGRLLNPIAGYVFQGLKPLRHLFYECSRVKRRWQEVKEQTRGTCIDIRGCMSLFEIIGSVI